MNTLSETGSQQPAARPEEMQNLRVNLLEYFKLPPLAVDWLLALYEASQVFDDYADGEPVSRSDLNRLIWITLVSLPQNPWYHTNSYQLLPVVANFILKWQGSDTVERNGQADEVSFVWRAGFYDVVLAAVLITHGPEQATEHADKVLRLYGEKFIDYREEFPWQSQQ